MRRMRHVERLVSIACDCGASGEAPIGALIECECGRTFTAEGPPAGHVAAIAALERRHLVLQIVSLVALIGLCALPLVVLDRSAALLVPVAAVAVWFATVRPHLQRRHRQAISALPDWLVAG